MAIIKKNSNVKITGGISPYIQSDTTNHKPINFNGGTNNVETICWKNQVVYMSKSITVEGWIGARMNMLLFQQFKGNYEFTINTPFGGHVWGEVKDNNGIYLSGCPEKNFDGGQQTISAKGDYGITSTIYPIHLYVYLTIYMNKEKTLQKVITFEPAYNAAEAYRRGSDTKYLNYGYWNDTEDVINTEIVKGTFTNKIVNNKLFDKITTTCSNTAFSFTSSQESGGKVTVYRNNAGSRLYTSFTVNNLESGKTLYYKIVYDGNTTTGSIYNSTTLKTSFTKSVSWSIPANTYIYATGESTSDNTVAVKFYYSLDNSNWYGGDDIFGKNTSSCGTANTVDDYFKYNNRYISSANLTSSLPTLNISGLYARYYASDGTNKKNYTDWEELGNSESTGKIILSGLGVKTWGIYIEYSTGKTAKISEIYLGNIVHDGTTTETTTIDIEPFD